VENVELDNLWMRVRYFLDDLDGKGDKKEVFGKKSNRERFQVACKDFDLTTRGIVQQFVVEKAFIIAGLVPRPTQAEYK
jgi:hypothetical protein